MGKRRGGREGREGWKEEGRKGGWERGGEEGKGGRVGKRRGGREGREGGGGREGGLERGGEEGKGGRVGKRRGGREGREGGKEKGGREDEGRWREVMGRGRRGSEHTHKKTISISLCKDLLVMSRLAPGFQDSTHFTLSPTAHRVLHLPVPVAWRCLSLS